MLISLCFYLSVHKVSNLLRVEGLVSTWRLRSLNFYGFPKEIHGFTWSSTVGLIIWWIISCRPRFGGQLLNTLDRLVYHPTSHLTLLLISLYCDIYRGSCLIVLVFSMPLNCVLQTLSEWFSFLCSWISNKCISII